MERKKTDRISYHPDTGRKLDEEESQLITDYNSDRRNFSPKNGNGLGLEKIPKTLDLVAHELEGGVFFRAELKNLGLKDA